MAAPYPAILREGPYSPHTVWMDADSAVPPLSASAPRWARIGDAQISRVVGVFRDALGGLFVMRYWLKPEGDDHYTAYLVLDFWAHGVRGSIDCEDVAAAQWTRKRKAKYVGRKHWNQGYHTVAPNWGVRGERGRDARYGWALHAGPAPTVKVSGAVSLPVENVSGPVSVSVRGKADLSETFGPLLWFLFREKASLRAWVEEDQA